MPKITKHAEFLDTLRNMVTKEGSTAGQATGVPGHDTHPASTSESTEHVNKNEEGHPEHNPQGYKQEKGKEGPLHVGKNAEDVNTTSKGFVDTGAAKPGTAIDSTCEQTSAKKANEEKPAENHKLAELGQLLLDTIQNMQTKEGATAGKATGVPGKDTHPASTSDSTEHVNKNKEGHPENNPQGYKQEKGKEGPLHVKASEEATDIDKQASFELGRQFCRSFLQANTTTQQDMYKDAGRKDFETLITQAAAELDQKNAQEQGQLAEKQAEEAGVRDFYTVANQMAQTKQASALYDEQYAEKQAEEAGAQTFHAMMKQAQDEYQANQVKQAFEQQLVAIHNEKVAAEQKAAEFQAQLLERDTTIQKKAEEEKRAQEFHTWGNYVVEQVMEKLRSEPAR